MTTLVYDGDRLVDVEYFRTGGRLTMWRLAIGRGSVGNLPGCWPAARLSGRDAVAQGGTFEFVSPGGKTDIFYDPPASRGRPGPLSGPDLADPAHTLSLDDPIFAGNVVVINVWGQWCGPCRAEVSQLQQVYDATRGSGVSFLGIDVRDNNRQAALDFVNDRHVTFPSIYDPAMRTLIAFGGKYPTTVIPSTLVLDRQHRVAAVFLRELLADDLQPVVQRVAQEAPRARRRRAPAMTGFTQIAAAGPLLVALGVCLLAGLVSFASPCVVPLVPGYLSYLAAVVGVDEQPPPGAIKAPPAARWRVAGSAALFVAGFTTVFVLGTVAVLGMTTTLITNQLLLQRVGGVLTIVMGLVFVGLVPALQRQARFSPRQLTTVAGAPLLGAVFALGWTPCLGPTLTGVITVASATDGANVARGIALVIAYCLGLGIPFVLLAFGSAGAVAGTGLAAAAHPRHPDLRRRAADRGRRPAGHRGMERLHLLAARRVRVRREVADLIAPDARADAKSHKTKGFSAISRLLDRGPATPGAR